MSSSVATKAFDAGFGQHMVPVTRANEPQSGRIDPKDMGKCPGEKNNRGEWFPINLNNAQCANRAEAEKWDKWGANVGLAMGREAGLYAFDSDIDDPQAAQAARAALATALPAGTPMRNVDDPNHHRFLFMVRVTGAKPAGTKLVYTKGNDTTGIDLLGEGKQFVAWGIHNKTGRPYQWNVNYDDFINGAHEVPSLAFDDLANVISEIDTAMASVGWSRVSGTVSASVSGTTERGIATEYELNRWLALVPNTDTEHDFDDRGQWVAMGHAIWGASAGADWGRGAWLRWCDQRPQNPGEPERVWDTLKDDGRVDLGFIRDKARQRSPHAAAQLGFELAKPVDADAIEAMAQAIAANALWPHLHATYVFVESHDRFYNLQTNMSLTRAALEQRLSDKFTILKNETPQHFDKTCRTVVQLFAKHPGKVVADGFTYWPGQPRICQDSNGALLINHWTDAEINYKPKVSETDVKVWLEHLEYLCGDAATAHYLVKWFAFVVKHHGDKPNHHPLLMTPPGTGKDSALIPVIYAVGRRNAREVSADDLAGQWTDYAEYRLLHVSETRQHSRGGKSSHDVMNDLKTYLADKPETVGVHRKGKDKYQIPNLSAWVFFSNEYQPVYLGEGDRRLWVIDNMKAVKKDPSYYEKLHKWLNQNKHLVASFLRDYPLTHKDIQAFKGPAPDTVAKQRLINANRDPVLQAMEELVVDARNGVGHPVLIVTMEDVAADLRDRVPRLPAAPQLGRYMKQVGARPVSEGSDGRPVPVKGANNKRLWILADTDAAGNSYANLTPKEAAEIFMSKKPRTGAVVTSTGTTLKEVKDDVI